MSKHQRRLGKVGSDDDARGRGKLRRKKLARLGQEARRAKNRISEQVAQLSSKGTATMDNSEINHAMLKVLEPCYSMTRHRRSEVWRGGSSRQRSRGSVREVSLWWGGEKGSSGRASQRITVDVVGILRAATLVYLRYLQLVLGGLLRVSTVLRL